MCFFSALLHYSQATHCLLLLSIIQSLSRTGIDHLMVCVCVCLTCCSNGSYTFSRVESVQWLSLAALSLPSLLCSLCTFCNVICFAERPFDKRTDSCSVQVDSALLFARRVKFVPIVLLSWRLHYALACGLSTDYLFIFRTTTVSATARPCPFSICSHVSFSA